MDLKWRSTGVVSLREMTGMWQITRKRRAATEKPQAGIQQAGKPQAGKPQSAKQGENRRTGNQSSSRGVIEDPLQPHTQLLPSLPFLRQRLGHFSHRNPLLFCAIAVAAGVLMDDRYSMPPWFWIGVTLSMVTAWCVLRQTLCSTVSFIGVLLSLGGFLHANHQHFYQSAKLVSDGVPMLRHPDAIDRSSKTASLASNRTSLSIKPFLNPQTSNQQNGIRVSSDGQNAGTIVVGTICNIPRLARSPLASQSIRRSKTKDNRENLARSPQSDSADGLPHSRQTKFSLRLESMRHGKQMYPSSGVLGVIIEGERPDLCYGDRIRLFGNLRYAKPPTGPGVRDRRAYFRAQGWHGQFVVNDVSLVDRFVDPVIVSGVPSRRSLWDQTIGRIAATPAAWLGKMATSGRNVLMRRLGDVNGPLAVGLVVGQRDAVPPSVRDDLLATGTVHLLSVSGLHLAIVVAMATTFCRILRTSMFWKVVTILLACGFYTALTGGRPPVMRAAVLIATFVLAFGWGQRAQPINTLALAALVLIWINPRHVFDIGVHLSFLAVVTLMTAGRGIIRPSASSLDAAEDVDNRIEKLEAAHRSMTWIYIRQSMRGVRSLLWFSACVTAMTTPMVWYHFHVVSPIAIIANVVLSPLLFWSLATGLLTVVFSWVMPSMEFLPAWGCEYGIASMLSVIQMAVDVPGGHAWLPAPPAFWVITFYVVMLATLFFNPNYRSRRIRMAWIVVWCIGGYFMATDQSEFPEKTFEANFVDVGHGTAVVMRDGNDGWLYDCGRLGNDDHQSFDIEDAIWSIGMTKLRGVFLSHADADHFNSLPGILRRFDVECIYTPPEMFSSREPAVQELKRIIQDHHVPVQEISRGDRIRLGEHYFAKVLHPGPPPHSAGDNANSLVLSIQVGDRPFLLPGDLEPPGTAVLTSLPRPAPGGVLMAPHHGSLRMEADMVLGWSRPAETVVSGGRRAASEEVERMLGTTGSGVHVTSRHGSIRVRMAADAPIEIRRYLEQPWE